MIHFTSTQEPPYFDHDVRQPGRRHLTKYPSKTNKFYACWRNCASDLQAVFSSLCAYSVIEIKKGDVEHFVSQTECCQTNQKHLIYEWSNYRYADPELNQRKSKLLARDILDPFDVQNNWFNIDLPSCLLKRTNELPAELVILAKNTIDRLQLNRGAILDFRFARFTEFHRGKITLSIVNERSPMVARAIVDRLEELTSYTSNPMFALVLSGDATMGELMRNEPTIHTAALSKLFEVRTAFRF